MYLWDRYKLKINNDVGRQMIPTNFGKNVDSGFFI